jgi:hypothetical protein
MAELMLDQLAECGCAGNLPSEISLKGAVLCVSTDL